MTAVPAQVSDFLASVTPAVRRRDADTLLELMHRATGLEPELHGSIVGFGTYHYRYDSGREGDAPAAGFSPRKAAMSVYLNDGIDRHTELLARLGPHTAGVGCLYLKDLSDIDLDILEQIVASSFQALTASTYTQRAREGA